MMIRTLNIGLAALSILSLQSCGLPKLADDASVLTQAKSYVNQENLSAASNEFSKLIAMEKHPRRRLFALMEHARCCLSERAFDRAEASCKEAERLCRTVFGANDPLNLTIWLYMARAQLGLKHFDDAERTCGLGIVLARVVPDGGEWRGYLLRLKLADVRAARGRYQEAISLYRDLQKLSDVRYVTFRLALCLDQAGRNDEARVEYRNCLPPLSDKTLSLDYKPLFDQYLNFLKRQRDMDEYARVAQQEQEWLALSDDFSKWLAERSAKSSRFKVMRSYARWDLEDVLADRKL